MTDRPRLVSSTAAARVVGVDPTTLWRWHTAGIVTAATTTVGGHLRWDLEDLQRQIQRRAEGDLNVAPDSVTEPVHRADRPEHQPVVAAIVTSHLGVLVGRRNDNRPPWTFIAGEVEPGESIADAAVREVKEETGLIVKAAGREIGRRVHPKTRRTMIYLACSPAQGTDVFVGDEEELAEVRWLTLPEVDELLPGVFEPVREHLSRTIT